MNEREAKSLNSDPHPCIHTEVMTSFSAMSQQYGLTRREIFHGTKCLPMDSLILASTFSDLSHNVQSLIGPVTCWVRKKNESC